MSENHLQIFDGLAQCPRDGSLDKKALDQACQSTPGLEDDNRMKRETFGNCLEVPLMFGVWQSLLTVYVGDSAVLFVLLQHHTDLHVAT